MYFSTCTLHVLCYCVFDWHVLIHSDSMENLHGGKALRTTWHMTFPEEENGDLEANYSHYLKGSGVNEGHQLVVRAAKRVWEELYACKKPVRKGVVQDRQVLFKKILLNSCMLSALYIYIYWNFDFVFEQMYVMHYDDHVSEQALEEVFKTQLNNIDSSSTSISSPDIFSVR